MTSKEATLEELTDKRFRLKQDYLTLRSLTKASSLRRGLAGAVDLYIGLVFIISNPDFLPMWVQYAFLGVYFVFRDFLFKNASLGKIIFGLRPYDYESLNPALTKQIMIRGVIYSTTCVLLCLGSLIFAIAAAVIIFLPFGIFGLFLLYSNVDLLSGLGYSHEDGRTIPDDWAGTHILSQQDVDMVRVYEDKLDKLSIKIKALQEQ